MIVDNDTMLIDAAVRVIWNRWPYYANAIGSLRIVADPNVPTMATSADWVTHYNPATVAKWTATETAAVLVHELEHLLRRHYDRCGDRDPARFNIAGDAEINQRLTGLPDGAVYPETLGLPRGRTAEVYYGASEAQPQDGDDSGDGQPGDGSGNGSGESGDGPPAKCGSAAGGPTQAHEAGDADDPGPGAADNGKAARADAARSIMGSGHLPGTEARSEMREWAERELGIDRSAWYSALSAAVGHVMAPYGAPTRWTWPGRRDMRDMGGAMVPRWTGERPSCAVIIDTSNSIMPFDLEMAAAAGHFIGRMADVTFYACDTWAYRLGNTIPEHLPGGGGTDLRVGIAMAIAEGARAVVVITDCFTPWPTEYTGVPLIIGANPVSAPIIGPVPDPRFTRWTPPEWATVLPVVSA